MEHAPETPPEAKQEKPSSIFKIFITRLLIPAVIVVAGVALAVVLIKTKPVTETSPAKRTARLVETILVSPTSYQVKIEAMGLVEAKNRIDLKSRVTGEIVQVSDQMIPGNTFNQGEVLFKVDPRDYELSVSSQEANYQQAKASLMLEKGQQLIAKTDYEMTGNTLNGEELDLVLRKPQLIQAEAIAESAQAALESAQLNLSRSEVKAPFDALVIDKTASLGSVVNTSTTLATLADSNEFWVELTIPVRDSGWIGLLDDISHEPVEVTIFDQLAWKKGQKRIGHVAGLSREVDSNSRMAKVVVSVKDPLSLKTENIDQPKLLLGSFVRGEIDGKHLTDVLVISRDYLRQGDILWTVDENNRLKFHEVDVLYSGTENVVIRNQFEDVIRLVTSNLSVPVEGMMVRYEGGPVMAGQGPGNGNQKPSGNKNPNSSH